MTVGPVARLGRVSAIVAEKRWLTASAIVRIGAIVGLMPLRPTMPNGMVVTRLRFLPVATAIAVVGRSWIVTDCARRPIVPFATNNPHQATLRIPPKGPIVSAPFLLRPGPRAASQGHGRGLQARAMGPGPGRSSWATGPIIPRATGCKPGEARATGCKPGPRVRADHPGPRVRVRAASQGHGPRGRYPQAAQIRLTRGQSACILELGNGPRETM